MARVATILRLGRLCGRDWISIELEKVGNCIREGLDLRVRKPYTSARFVRSWGGTRSIQSELRGEISLSE